MGKIEQTLEAFRVVFNEIIFRQDNRYTVIRDATAFRRLCEIGPSPTGEREITQTARKTAASRIIREKRVKERTR